jgi:hypothetical protein
MFYKKKLPEEELVINSENSRHAYPIRTKGLGGLELGGVVIARTSKLRGRYGNLGEYFSKRAFARTPTLRRRYGHYNEEAGGI